MPENKNRNRSTHAYTIRGNTAIELDPDCADAYKKFLPACGHNSFCGRGFAKANMGQYAEAIPDYDIARYKIQPQ